MSDAEHWEDHPTFGVVNFCRTTGCTDLVGSGVKHQHFLSLTIRRASVRKSFGEERYFGNESICEVWLSAAQFAELITTMGVMPGVPCTLKYVDGKSQGAVPKIDTSVKIAKDYAKEQLDEFAEKIVEYKSTAESILTKSGTITKGDKAALLNIFNTCLQEIKSNVPFYADILEEVSEKTLAKAKTEIESFVTMKVMQCGLDSLQQIAHVDKLTGVRNPHGVTFEELGLKVNGGEHD